MRKTGYLPLSVRRRSERAAEEARLRLYAENPDASPEELTEAVRRAVEGVVADWAVEGQRFAVHHPHACAEWLTVEGAVEYLEGLRGRARSAALGKGSVAEPSENRRSEEHDAAHRDAVRLARIVAPVAAGLVADGGQCVGEDFEAQLRRLLPVFLEDAVRQRTRPLAGGGSQGGGHGAECRLGVGGLDDGLEQCLDGFDGLPPSVDGTRVATEGECPCVAHECGRFVVGASDELVHTPGCGIDPLHEAVPSWRDHEFVARLGEHAFQLPLVIRVVLQEPVDHVKPGIVVNVRFLKCVDNGIASPVVGVGVTGDVESQFKPESLCQVPVVLKRHLDPMLDIRAEIRGNSDSGLEGRTLSSPLGQRNPAGLAHDDSSSVGGADASVASVGSGALEPTEEAPTLGREEKTTSSVSGDVAAEGPASSRGNGDEATEEVHPAAAINEGDVAVLDAAPFTVRLVRDDGDVFANVEADNDAMTDPRELARILRGLADRLDG